MLPKLQKHSKHIQEVKTLRDSAKKVKDQKIKADLNMLTDKLVELVDMIPEGNEVSIYYHGDWYDLCRGPHLLSTGRIGK